MAAVTLLSATLWPSSETPVAVNVNANDELLSEWDSETFGSESPPDCRFWNHSFQYRSSSCRHFSVFVRSGAPSTSRVKERALLCAANHETECILSAEIGLSVPAAYVYDHLSGEITEYLAPKIVPFEHRPEDYDPEFMRVRISKPDDEMETKMVLMNKTVVVNYMDMPTRSMKTKLLNGKHAYCVQLLREAYTSECWNQIG